MGSQMSSNLSTSGIRSLRIVTMGGGTGLSTLLKGLKRYVATGERETTGSNVPATIEQLCAVVTVTDDGGSSGRLRKEFHVLPPGDIRNCMAALSEDEALLSRLFQHRFQAGAGLNGHSFGNLFLTALTAITGDFAEAVKQSSGILKTRGHIYPATVRDVSLEATMADGSRVVGETNITASTKRVVEVKLVPPDVSPMPETLEAIAQADLITIGPGSLFTSLVPNLLVHGISEAVSASGAVKAFVCNLMTEANESLGLTAADHVRVLNKHAGTKLFDYALINQSPVSPELKAKYAAEGGSQIEVDLDAMEALGVRIILNDYLDQAEGVARHATGRVACDLLQLALRAPSRKTVSSATATTR